MVVVAKSSNISRELMVRKTWMINPIPRRLNNYTLSQNHFLYVFFIDFSHMVLIKRNYLKHKFD
jgi:hypothetical protein